MDGKTDGWTDGQYTGRQYHTLLKQERQQDLSQGQDSLPDSALPIT